MVINNKLRNSNDFKKKFLLIQHLPSIGPRFNIVFALVPCTCMISITVANTLDKFVSTHDSKASYTKLSF
jgi:hypothetical protein